MLLATLLPRLAAAQTDDEPPSPNLRAPVLVESATPSYPDAEREQGRAASVILLLVIDESGQVTDAEVTESAGTHFDAAALDAARALRFEPALRDGAPVPARIPFRFDFALDAERAADEAATPPPEADPAEARRVPSPPLSEPNPDATEPTSAPADPASEATGDDGDDVIDIDVQGEQPRQEPTKRVLTTEELTKLPGTNGDALRAIGTMPGVARPPGLTGMLLVRGSAPRDTQVLVEGITVPVAYHFGGLSSVLPSEVLERIDFYPGNFGPQVGRAMGGVVDIGIKSPRADRLSAMAQVDLVDARALVQAPISDSTRIMIGARRSWLDAWLGPVVSDSNFQLTAAPVYYDMQAMVEHDVSPDTRLRVLGYASSDSMRILNESPSASDPADGGAGELGTRFWRVQARLDSHLTSKLHWANTISIGQDYERFAFGPINARTTSLIAMGRSDLSLEVNDYVTAVAGLDTEWARHDAHWRFPALDLDGANPSPLFGRQVNELDSKAQLARPAAYAMLKLHPIERLELTPGVRVDYAQDTERFTYDPRLSARYDLTSDFPRTTLKGGVGVFHQPPVAYQSVEPWGNDGVRSPKAIHYSAGIEQELAPSVELSAEGFYKTFDDLIVTAPDASRPSGTAYANVGSGRAFGGEFMLRYQADSDFFGWVAYTLSRSERRDAPGQPLYRFDYDQTHILNALASYDIGWGVRLGARFRYVTGNPYTPYVGGVADYDAGAYSPLSSPEHNSERSGAFHQLDVRVDKTWNFDDWQLTAYLDVQNTYNHENPEGVRYNYDYSKTAATNGLPLLPIIGIRGEL